MTKKIFACLLTLMLCASLPAASAGQTAGLRITLEELDSAALSDAERESLAALLDAIEMDIVTTDEGVFALSLGSIKAYYTEDTGLLIHLPDQLMSGSADSDEALGAALLGESEPGTWYRPTFSGMPINSALLRAMQPDMMQQLIQALGLEFTLNIGGQASDPAVEIQDPLLMAQYLQEDLAMIAQRIEPQINAFLSTGPAKTLLAGLSGQGSIRLNSSTLSIAIREAQSRLDKALNSLISESKPDGQSAPASAAEGDLPELLKGLHFSEYYAQLYQDFLASLSEPAASGGPASLFGLPSTLPPFIFEASEGRVTFLAGDDFLLTADILSEAEGSVTWSGQILTSGTQPISFKLELGRESAALDMHNEKGGIRASLNFSLPGQSKDWALITLDAASYSFGTDGSLSGIKSVSGTLYADETTLSLQGSEGVDDFSAVFTAEETRMTAELYTTHHGQAANPTYRAEIDWTEGFTAQMTQTTPYGSVTGGRLWILPEGNSVSFGLASIESTGQSDWSETFMQGSYTQEVGGERLHLDFDGTLIDLEWKLPQEDLLRAVIDVSQGGQTLLHAALDIQAAEGLPLPEPHDIQDLDLGQQ